MKKTLLVDMDGVLADVYGQLIQAEFAESGNLLDRESLTGVDEIVAFPNGLKHVNKPGFFRNAPLIYGAVNALKELNDVYQVYIVSAAMEFPSSLEDKYHWLTDHFPFISWKQIILCGSKIPVHGDILIDDHFKNLDHFKGRTLLFTQPHNTADARGHERVNGWDDITKLLF